MLAEYHVDRIAQMNEEQNLRNTCRQIEDEYVGLRRHATHNGYLISREWPRLGELNRWHSTEGLKMRFVTTRKRSIQVRLPNGQVIAECEMKPGLAQELYLEAGRILDMEQS